MYAVGSANAETAWTETVASLHGRLRIAGPPGLKGWVGWQTSEEFRVVRWRSDEEDIRRDAADVRADPRGTVELLFPLSGRAIVEQAGQCVRIDADASLLCGLDRPLGLWHSPGFEALALVVPESRLMSRAAWFDHRPTVFEGRRGLSRVAFDLLRTVSDENGALGGVEFDAACERALDLACLAAAGTREADSGHRSLVRATIRRFIAEHAADPDLDGEMVVSALGWSRRYLQSVLQDEGATMTELIRNARLDLARVMLEQKPGVSIGRIAAECGFGSHAAFTTAFRTRFGMTPRETRSG